MDTEAISRMGRDRSFPRSSVQDVIDGGGGDAQFTKNGRINEGFVGLLVDQGIEALGNLSGGDAPGEGDDGQHRVRVGGAGHDEPRIVRAGSIQIATGPQRDPLAMTLGAVVVEGVFAEHRAVLPEGAFDGLVPRVAQCAGGVVVVGISDVEIEHGAI